MDADVRVGTVVRVELHGRRVGGWVVTDGPTAPADRELRPIAKVTGWGPPSDVLALASWAAWRWAGRRASLLATASAPGAVRGLPASGAGSGKSADVSAVVGAELEGLIRSAFGTADHRVLRLPPSVDPFPVIAAAVSRGPSLVLFPSVADAAHTAARLRRGGGAVALHPQEWATARAGRVSVVGARAAAWAPMPEVAAVVVVDGHDESYQEERAPTWHAREVAVERARRAGVPAVVVSACPDLEMTAAAHEVLTPSRNAERSGWPIVEVADRRLDDPRRGLFGDRLVEALRRSERAVCVLNRKGRARLLACAACGDLARCERCEAAVALEDEALACRRCGEQRPSICAACGGTRLKALRLGVRRVREELAALTGRDVGEVTAETGSVPDVPILVGTEAVLHRGGRADLVAFLDFDQELLAPRYRAGEQALALLARAGRIVGGRRAGGRVLVQTRVPDHEVLDAALHGDPTRLETAERGRREALRFPPYSALARVSGPAAADLIGRLGGAPLELLGPDEGAWLLRAPDHQIIADALAAAGRPPGRLRIEVDPLRI